MRLRAVVILTGVLSVLAQASHADTLITADGRELEGKVVSQGADKVVFDVHKGTSVLQMVFKASEVKKITLGALAAPASKAAPTPAPAPASQPVVPAGPTYFIIPIKQEVGVYVTAAYIEQALKDADRLKATVVVLEVDSPGGLTGEAVKIIDSLCKAKDIRLVAYIKSAISAAAIISLSCKEIYLDERATIGGALSFAMGPALPEEINEKMQSIWRASCRSAAEMGGHQSILAEGMVDKDIEIQIVQQNGRPLVKEGLGSNMLKRKGKLLTMTAKEAIACGLANGIVAGYDDLGARLGLSGWTKPFKNAEAAYDKHAGEIKITEQKVKTLIGLWLSRPISRRRRPAVRTRPCGTSIRRWRPSGNSRISSRSTLKLVPRRAFPTGRSKTARGDSRRSKKSS